MRGPLMRLGKGMSWHGEGHVAFLFKGSLGCILLCQSCSLTLGHISYHGDSWVFFIGQSKSGNEMCRQDIACFSGSKWVCVCFKNSLPANLECIHWGWNQGFLSQRFGHVHYGYNKSAKGSRLLYVAMNLFNHVLVLRNCMSGTIAGWNHWSHIEWMVELREQSLKVTFLLDLYTLYSIWWNYSA